MVDGPGTPSARFAATAIVGNNHRVRIKHCTLEARVGAHVFADLLAHPAGIAIGGKAVEEDPE